MYEETFGTDWETLSAEEALRRMFALGVASALGETHDREFDRIRRLATTSYQRNVLELAFEEGRTRVADHSGDFADDEEAWTTIVDEATATADADDRPGETTDRPDAVSRLPSAVNRADFLEFDADDLSRLRLPEMLRRDD